MTTRKDQKSAASGGATISYGKAATIRRLLAGAGRGLPVFCFRGRVR